MVERRAVRRAKTVTRRMETVGGSDHKSEERETTDVKCEMETEYWTLIPSVV